jgi:endoglucanase
VIAVRLAAALALASCAADARPALACGAASWPHWRAYADRFIARSGRVVDPAAGDVTTSEGQAYALFMSLVANDRVLFDRVLRWTRDHLAGGALDERLPAWKWGSAGGAILDDNAAADADLWLGYTLIEAGRLWREPSYDELGRRLLQVVVDREVVDLPGLGPMLLPAPTGFEVERGKAWRLNPSYLPPPIVRRLAVVVGRPWGDVLDGAVRLLRESGAHGLAPDWTLYRAGQGFMLDPVRGGEGSYDAIRTYLWSGMLHPNDPNRPVLVGVLGGMLARWHARRSLPEKIDLVKLEERGNAPPGFAGALLPQAVATRDRVAVQRLEQRLAGSLVNGLYGDPPAYYDQNLILFGKGFAEGRFAFGEDGRLVTQWGERCDARP